MTCEERSAFAQKCKDIGNRGFQVGRTGQTVQRGGVLGWSIRSMCLFNAFLDLGEGPLQIGVIYFIRG